MVISEQNSSGSCEKCRRKIVLYEQTKKELSGLHITTKEGEGWMLVKGSTHAVGPDGIYEFLKESYMSREEDVFREINKRMARECFGCKHILCGECAGMLPPSGGLPPKCPICEERNLMSVVKEWPK